MIRDRFLLNEMKISIGGEKCKVRLYDRDGALSSYTLIDPEEYSKVCKYKWYKQTTGYIYNNKVGYLHRFILGIDSNSNSNSNQVIDHINMDRLDNRKLNLRIVTRSENSISRNLPTTSRSGFKGVSWSKVANKWHVYIYYGGRRKHLGYFSDKLLAGKIYNLAALKHHGEFAFLNEV